MNTITFTARVIVEIQHGPNISNSLKVGVFEVSNDTERQIGEYIRNYHSLFRTFYHFRKNSRDYALYSPNYTATRVMELPSCKDIGGEEPHAFGFCPVDFYVPWGKNLNEEACTAEFGFVAGCIWGDDTAWKIEFLDLSEVEKGSVKRDDRFGRIELPDKNRWTLEQAVDMSWYMPDEPYISIAMRKVFDLNTGKLMPGWK